MDIESLKYMSQSGEERKGVLFGELIIHRGTQPHDVIISPIEQEVASVISHRTLEKTPELEQAMIDFKSSLQIIAECLLLNTAILRQHEHLM